MCESPSKPLSQPRGNDSSTPMPSTPAQQHADLGLQMGSGFVNESSVSRKVSTTDVKLVTSPPDGGWGWVVVFCSFMVHVLADGVTYTFGIFYIKFVEYFEESKGKTAWVASILVSTTFLCGPIASALTNLYGCRVVTIAGSLLAASGMFISIWAPNVTFLFFSIGILTGMGLGLMYLPAIVSVSMYFDRKRAFATGIAVCGSGFGTFVLAPVIEALVDFYGWQGALMITSGMLLNCVVFGALMRPPEYIAVVEVDTTVDLEFGDVDNNTARFPNENISKEREAELVVSENLLRPSNTIISLQNHHKLDSKEKLHHRSVCHLSVNSEPELVLIRTPSIDRNLYLEREALNSKQSYASLRKRLSYTSQPSISVHSVQQREDTRGAREKFSAFMKTITDSIDIALLLKSPIFILFALSNFFTSIGFNVPYVYIADIARRQLNVDDSKASLLLSLIGLSNTASRVLLGYLSDKRCVNRILLYNVCIATCGVATALSIFCTDYVQLSVYCIIFGATSGAFISLTSVILVDLMGLEKLNNAFGLVLLFEGIACLIGPPLTGWIFDWTGSYNWGFIFSGVVIATGGITLCLIPCVRTSRSASPRKKARRMK
ncbi:monocarboxylate transporter 12-like [Galendromus occidentalis]|uniref:Monocarboxylate transporter 12-like n=1 Tax=Galendromus occidentalis TaxID=34638 RepID=A0AAJ6QW00_9ACAR|nr:monocarboxylate transporter 12-like [Galendromus occidentalis]